MVDNAPLLDFEVEFGMQITDILEESTLLNSCSVAGWQVNTQAGPLKLLPFSEIQDEPYSTYVTVT